jgi:branched-chain amino acid transport system substrate-binding protein
MQDVKGHIENQNRIASKAQSCKADLKIIKFLRLCVLAASIIFPLRAAQAGKYELRARSTDYAGPGRDEPACTDVNEVLIGYFGPNKGDMWYAAQLAIERANLAGGYNGLPFRLVAGWSESPWTAGAAKVVRMAYTDKVRAIIGGIDGPSTHLAEQVVTKARLPLINPVSSDKSINLANVPWMFSCVPADHILAPVLAEEIATLAGFSRPEIVFVSATDHDSHLFTVELLKFPDPYQISPAYHFEFDPAKKDFNELVEKIISVTPDVLVLIAGAQPIAQIVTAIRQKGFTGLIFGGPSMGRRCFWEEAGRNAEGVIFPLLYRPPLQVEPNDFESEFLRRFGRQPDWTAAYTYDSVNLLVAAIRKGGLNRACINDAVRNLSPYKGITGIIEWDGLGSNKRQVGLGTIKDGRIVPLSQIEPPATALSSSNHLQ